MARAFIDRNTRPLTRCAGYLCVGIAAWIICNHAQEALGEEPSKPKAPPTFTRDVAPILQKKCQNCHRSHQVGPFALETYEQASKRAPDIAAVASERSMPPWKPEPGVGPKLKHDQSLSQPGDRHPGGLGRGEGPAGRCQGHAAASPFRLGLEARARPTSSWSRPRSSRPGLGSGRLSLLRDPDEPRPRCVSLGDRLPPGRARASSTTSSHSSIPPVPRGRGIEAEPGAGYTSFAGPGVPVYEELGFWAPGTSPPLPAGIGHPLPRQSDVILQVHYHPSGKPEVDRTRIGRLLLPRAGEAGLPLEHRHQLRVPRSPRASRTSRSRRAGMSPSTSRSSPSPRTCTCSGSDMRMIVTSPDGPQDLINIPDWDPSWQSTYFFQKTVARAAGSVVKVVAHFDNSDHPQPPTKR